MRIIIAGSRDFNDYELLKQKTTEVLNQVLPIRTHITSYYIPDFEIVSGGARGADRLGERLAREYKIPLKIIEADWDTYGKSAGYRRNEQMALYAKEDNGVLIAFWDGTSKGTNHMINLAEKHGLKVFIVKY